MPEGNAVLVVLPGTRSVGSAGGQPVGHPPNYVAIDFYPIRPDEDATDSAHRAQW
jgi:hypothetical protein